MVGGGEHDWTYMLDTLNLLEKDLSIGRAVHLLGVVSIRVVGDLGCDDGWRGAGG